MKAYLITGSSGYIGSQYIKYLLAKDSSVRIYALARSEERLQSALGEYFSAVEAVICDVISADFVSYVSGKISQLDAIVHLAAVTQSAYMVAHPVEVADGIILGTKNILALADKMKVKSMLYVSSMEVYGAVDCSDGHRADENELGSVELFKERSCYPLAKRMAEHYCYDYFKGCGVPVKIARLAQSFGRGIQASDNRVFAQFARSAVRGEDIILHTAGRSVGNYCGIDDVLSAFDVLLAKGANGEAYNVVNEANTMSIREMAELAAAELSGGRSTVRVEIPEGSSVYAADTGLRLSGKKMQALGWYPQQSLLDMYRDLIKDAGSLWRENA